MEGSDNVTSSDLATGGSCSEWREAQDVLYQVASLFFAVAFLIPDDVRCHVMLLRATLCLGCACMVVWGGAILCHVDVLAWYLVFLSINIFHFIYAVSDSWPTRLPAEVEDVYAKVFKPLLISRQNFKELIGYGQVGDLPHGASYGLPEDLPHRGSGYAIEGATHVGETLSILLRGRLKVTRTGIFLHSINANEFVDSIEYETCSHASDEQATFQVTITTLENCRLLSWPVQDLRHYLDSRPSTATVFRLLLGRDIANKMYRVQDAMLGNPASLRTLQSTSQSHRPATAEAAAAAGSSGQAERASRPTSVIQLQASLTPDGVRGANGGRTRGFCLKTICSKRPTVEGSSTSIFAGDLPSVRKTLTPVGPYSPSQVSYETFV